MPNTQKATISIPVGSGEVTLKPKTVVPSGGDSPVTQPATITTHVGTYPASTVTVAPTENELAPTGPGTTFNPQPAPARNAGDIAEGDLVEFNGDPYTVLDIAGNIARLKSTKGGAEIYHAKVARLKKVG
jgi:hypothetical protein